MKDDKIIGEGLHYGAGLPHAEVNAINAALGTEIEGSTLYCNLEPCCHTNKRTPPCTDLIIAAGIKRVVISNIDPNPFVQNKGVKKLIENGIDVSIGELEHQGASLNRIFFKNMHQKLPYVTLKMACSLDGRICLENGTSKWITSPLSRQHVHQIRLEHDAILVGINTFLTDAPSLNTRDDDNKVIKENKKIIFGDMTKLLPEHHHKICTNDWILIHTGCSSFSCPREIKIYHFDHFERSLLKLLKALYVDGIKSVLVEGGQKVFSSFIDARLFDDVFLFYAPIFLGNGKSNYMNKNISTIDACRGMKIVEIKSIENNFVVHLNQE